MPALPSLSMARSSQSKSYLPSSGSIFAHARGQLSPHLWVRIIEFVPELPKTISGKIRRVELRAREAARVQSGDESGQHRDRDYR